MAWPSLEEETSPRPTDVSEVPESLPVLSSARTKQRMWACFPRSESFPEQMRLLLIWVGRVLRTPTLTLQWKLTLQSLNSLMWRYKLEKSAVPRGRLIVCPAFDSCPETISSLVQEDDDESQMFLHDSHPQTEQLTSGGPAGREQCTFFLSFPFLPFSSLPPFLLLLLLALQTCTLTSLSFFLF